MRLVVVALASLLGCSPGVAGAPCSRHSDCRVGLTCGRDGTCAGAVVDAATPIDEDAVSIPPAPPADASDLDASEQVFEDAPVDVL